MCAGLLGTGRNEWSRVRQGNLTGNERERSLRIDGIQRLLSNWFWRFVPISIVIALSSYILGKQIVRPHHRMIKASLLLLVLIILLRFEMVYAIYFFVVLFPFPSGVVLTSTNVILMTLVTLIWLVRAKATGKNLYEKTDVDIWILLFLGAYLAGGEVTATIGANRESEASAWRIALCMVVSDTELAAQKGDAFRRPPSPPLLCWASSLGTDNASPAPQNRDWPAG